MRAGFVTSVAANIISSTTSAANGASQIAAAAGDDGFAAILGGACATPDSGAAANGNASTADTSAAQAPASQSPDTAKLSLQEISSGDAKPAQDDNSPPAADFSATQNTQDAVAAKPGSRINIFGNGAARPANGARSQPATVSADTADTTEAPTDPILAQLLAAQQATPAVNAPAPASSPATQAVEQTGASNSDPSGPLGSTDVAAASVAAGGATVKPGKADDNAAPADGDKSQKQATTAAAVADLGKAATRVFSDQRSSAAHALAVPAAAADQTKNNSQSDGSSQQNPNSPPNTAPVAATANTPASTAVAPTHVQAPPQPDATVNAAAVTTAPAASASVSAPAQVSAQLHIAHQTAAPDVNALAFNIASKSEGGARHFDIRLDPAELGRVDVRLTVDDAGKAQAILSVEKPQTLELLQKDQGHLERALKDAGLDLSQNGLSFSLKGQQQQQAGGDATPRGRSHAMRAIAAVGETASTLSLGSAASSDARLDIRV